MQCLMALAKPKLACLHAVLHLLISTKDYAIVSAADVMIDIANGIDNGIIGAIGIRSNVETII